MDGIQRLFGAARARCILLIYEILLRGCLYMPTPSRKCRPIKYISRVGLCCAQAGRVLHGNAHSPVERVEGDTSRDKVDDRVEG